MLDFLRRNAQSLFFQIVVVVIILAFVFWGGSSMMNNRQSAITVNGEEISFQEMDKAYNQAYERFAAQFGGNLPKGLLDSLDIKQQVINQLIQDSLLRQGGKQMGVLVSADEIQKRIQSMAAFQKNGQFNMEQYEFILANNRLTPTKFEDSILHELLVQKTIDDISSFITIATEEEILDVYKLENELASVDFVKISPASFTGKISFSEDELAEWYKKNQDRYKTEPEIKLQYLSFLYGEMGEKIDVPESDVEKYYTTHITDYQEPESRHARHILVKASPNDPEEARKKAQEIKALAEADDDFAKLARTYSEGPSAPSGGDLGFFTRGRMVPAFEQAVFSMKEGEISEVVETNFGYHIIKLEEINPSSTKPLEEVRASIVSKLKLDQARPLAFQMANKAYEGIIGAGSLANYVRDNKDVNLHETGFFKQSEPPEPFRSSPEFLTKAFALKKGDLSSMIESGDGYVILFALDIKEPEVPPLADVEVQVKKDYVKDQAEARAKEAAEKLIASINEGKSIQAAAAEAGMAAVNSGFFTKATPNEKGTFPPSLMGKAFRLTMSAPVIEQPETVGEDLYVFTLKEKKNPEEKMKEEDRKRYEEALLSLKRQQLLSAWLENKRQDADITVHSSLQK